MSLLWKMAVFTEKPPVTSSNCYETIKNASILIKLGTNVNWTIAFVTTCSVLNFPLPWQRRDISKWQKITILPWFIPSKLFQSAATSQGIEVESKALQRWLTLPFDRPGVIFSLSKVQNFLGDEGDYGPLQTPQTEGGTSPFWQPPGVSFGWGRRWKGAPFLATFLKR
jgi:hypothetical protein